MKTIIIADRKDEKWLGKVDIFVDSHPYGNIFQTSKYYSLFLYSGTALPVAFIQIDDNENVIGVLIAVIHYQKPLTLKFLTARSVISGGPIIADDRPDIARLLIKSYDDYISTKAIYSQFRNLNDQSSFHSLFEASEYKYEDHLNIHIDLTKSEEQLWKEVHSKRRNEIRRAIKEDLKFKVLDSAVDFENSFSILKELYSRIKLPLYSKEIFEETFYNLAKTSASRFFGIFYCNKLIGTMYTFCYKDKIYNWFAGSNEDFLKIYPNDYLPWRVFLWAKENGFTTFDWGGAGKPGIHYGVRDYKAKFGGTIVNYGRFEKIHNKTLYIIARLGFKILQLIKS